LAQTTLKPKYNNKTLFSNYYLDNKVKTNAEWKKNDHIAAFSEIKEIYEKERKSFENFNEAQLIKHFLDPIFKSLFFETEVEEAAGSDFPDYAFFRDKTSRDEAHKNKGTISFYTNALAIGEVKKWDKELDGKPIHQLRNYLDVTEKKWGILTNGRKWRLFCKEKKRDEYYEIDLPSLLDNNDMEGFKYFFYFFRRDAFLLPENFLEQVLRESEDHAKAIGNNLKENIYKAMKIIADGFFGRPQNNLDRNNEAAQELVQKNTMLLLYRLLFLLYAEDRNLLDVTNSKYLNNHSFRRIKKEVEEKRGRIEQGYDYSGTTIWDRLKSLFELINVGSEAIGEKEFHVPAYNGGLFDTAKNPELEKWKIGDKYLAEAIRLLTWSDVNGAGGFVDYSELEIRHLGSIYEGLLEYKLKVAESDIVTKENEWVSLEKYNEGRKQIKAFPEFDEFSRTRKGELYLATDKGERKATGSYYTPDYIVNYIVKNTVGPVIDEKWKDAETKKQSFVDSTLSVKVLDPAMGSGHFLVGAVEFLAEKLLKAAQKDIEAGRMADEPRFSDQDWARREVVAHCIYGVDLNPMAVELAKVGLWLTTISKEKPLSFLDHRLKQGNSLIGTRLSEAQFYPDLKKKVDRSSIKQAVLGKTFIENLIDKIKELEKISDEKLENIKKKERIFKEFKELDAYKKSKAIANVYTAIFFGNEVTPTQTRESKKIYYDLIYALDYPSNWAPKVNQPWFKRAQEIAVEKSFFHWELEFPEIFFEGGAPKENPGWDAVVGNPPYVRIQRLNHEDIDFIFKLFETPSSKVDISICFLELGSKLVTLKGKAGFISTSQWLSTDYGIQARHYFGAGRLSRIIDFGSLPVFSEVSTYPAIFLITRTNNKILQYAHIGSSSQLTLNDIQKSPIKEIEYTSLGAESWILKGVDLRQKFQNNIFSSLKEYGHFHIGALTGMDDVFVVSKELIEKRKLESNLILPYAYRGEEIFRFEVSIPIAYIIYPYEEDSNEESVLISHEKLKKDYPNIYSYLSEFKDKLMQRRDSRKLYATEDNWYRFLRPGKFSYIKPKKLIIRGVATKSTVGILENMTAFNGANCPAMVLKETNYTNYLLSLLNSSLIAAYFYAVCPAKLQGYIRINANNLNDLPIRRISFTTPPARRAALFEEAKALYSEEAPDSQKILDFVGARLDAKPEESDVVHDLLAHLAERMIEMNKEKNAEIKGFLRWLEGEIGTPVEELANKTALKEYYLHDFDALAKVLEKNKKKLKKGYDPTRREPKENMEKEYNTSVGRLAPRLRRIEATDGLIDAIVYRLYGLNEDEIKIVGESISGNKDLNTKEDTKL